MRKSSKHLHRRRLTTTAIIMPLVHQNHERMINHDEPKRPKKHHSKGKRKAESQKRLKESTSAAIMVPKLNRWHIERAMHEAREIYRDQTIEETENDLNFDRRLSLRMQNIDSQITCLESLSTLDSFKPKNWRAIRIKTKVQQPTP